MKTAIVISGNLRTFFMPTRENPDYTLCDLFIKNILNINESDIFIFTDTNDFYYNGVQYYSTNKRIEILNNDAFRLHQKIDFIDNDKAREIISKQLNILGHNLKSLIIEAPCDVTKDPKFEVLNTANVKGSSPILLIHQFRKLKLAYKLLEDYEINNNFKYDVVVKWRFDISVHGKLKFQDYDYLNTDIYVAGDHSPIIYDWHMFGTRMSMGQALSLYDILGSFLQEGRKYLCEKCWLDQDICICISPQTFEITLAPEYHYYKLFKQNNIKIKNSGYAACPYRYQNINTANTLDDMMKKINIKATVVTYNSGIEIIEKDYV